MPNFSGIWTATQQLQALGLSIWPSPPGSPTGVSATNGADAQSVVSFTAPSNIGYPTTGITGYTVTSSPGGITALGSSSPITITGLTNGITYTFTVTAQNSTGTSAPSAPSNSITPVAKIYYAGLYALGTQNQGGSITSDSSDNIYVLGGVTDFYTVIKVARADASLTYQYKLNGNGIGRVALGLPGKPLSVSPQGDTYITSVDQNSNGYLGYFKINPSGTAVTWKYRAQLNDSYTSGGNQASVSYYGPSDDLFFAGQANDGSGRNIVGLIKAGTGGGTSWSTSFYYSTQQLVCTSIAQDYLSGDVYLGLINYSDSYAYIRKYNSGGTLQWTQRFYIAVAASQVSVACDSSNNVYASVVDKNNNTGNLLIKYNSSGTLQWQRKLVADSTECIPDGIAIDSSNNIYISGQMYRNASPAGYVAYFAKYNSSGTIQWQRTLEVNASSPQVSAKGLTLVTDGFAFTGNYYYSGASTGTWLLGIFPSNGTKTGTFTLDSKTWTYAASSFTEQAGTTSGGSAVFTAITMTSTQQATSGTLTFTNPTASLTKTNL
jgi:hypothetical protein